MALGTRDPEAPAPATVLGSELVTINRWQARDWEQAITAAYHPDEPPAVRGWNPAGEHGAPVGYDLVLATPRTLSALGWCFFSTDRGVADDIMRADHRDVQDVAVEFSVTTGSEVPVLVAHQFDSAGQPWRHTHVIVGAQRRGDGVQPDLQRQRRSATLPRWARRGQVGQAADQPPQHRGGQRRARAVCHRGSLRHERGREGRMG